MMGSDDTGEFDENGNRVLTVTPKPPPPGDENTFFKQKLLNTKKPKEIINTEPDAVFEHITPNFVFTNKVPVGYPSDGHADDKPQNTTTRTFARRKPIHTMHSLVTKTQKDEPGDPDGGVQSGTRGSIITPITHSPNVRAESHHVNRHEDTYHGNNQNHLMQAKHVHNTQTYTTSIDDLSEAPSQSTTGAQPSSSSALGNFGTSFMKESSTVQTAQAAVNGAQYFYNNPGQILPSAGTYASNLWNGIGSGLSSGYDYLSNLTPAQVEALPGQAAQGVKSAAVAGYSHYADIYQQGGAAGLAGALTADGVDVGVQYLLLKGAGKVAGTLGKGAETAEEAGAAAKRAGEAEAAEGNARVSRDDSEANKRGETCECP